MTDHDRDEDGEPTDREDLTGDPWYDVTAFEGGDGDARAIQRAVDAAGEDGGTVFLPTGEYVVRTAVTMRPGVRVVGAGMGATTVVAEGEGFAAFEGFGRVDDPIEDLGFADLAIDCSGLGGEGYDTGEKCIYLQYVRRCSIERVYAYGAPATGIGTDFMVESLVHGCIAERNGRFWEPGRIGANGIGIGAGRYDAESVVVSDCHALDNGNNGVMFEAQGPEGEDAHSGLMKAVGCSAVGNRIGFRDSADRRVTFLGCSAAENDESGVVVSGKSDTSFGARDHRIADCHLVDNSGAGIEVLDAAEDAALAVDDCTIADNGGCGVRVDAGGPVGGVSITDSAIHGNDGAGVLHRGGGRDVAVTGCAVHDNANGIHLDAAGGAYRGITLIGNRCRGSGEGRRRGIALEGPHTEGVVLGNTLADVASISYDERPEVLRDNVGYPTEGGGRTTVADGDVLNHGLAEEPSTVVLQSTSASRAFPREVDGEGVVVGLVGPAGEPVENPEAVFWEAAVR
ncbi:right-handed parallel beta-helix repeat-containing protein [Halalkalicoccus sp. NIPERK01]|uniref:right-handed parallel beta-helix repeat-containing protein n=1 Tax=Halalkalicoccus sp. NIPERK01 TaxID=3053469 RepID=UPI00256F5A50|nr:right-handed parallel beta-helix repeat-containing protein [Halalkalicoccus sp. NIPERK01]MDL5362601.1 right-handed parallel beta-helix repeat-containing protein [Halalkalicoccus sp. NIPERK01]